MSGWIQFKNFCLISDCVNFLCNIFITKNTCTQQTLAHPSNTSLENPNKIDNFSKLSKRQIVLTITAIKRHNTWPQILTTQTGNYFIFNLLVVIFTFKNRFCFIKTKRSVKISFKGLINNKRFVLAILLLNNGCWYQNPGLVAIFSYFESFSNQTFHCFCFKKRLFIRWPGFPS